MNLEFIKSFFLSSLCISVLFICFTTCAYCQVLRSANSSSGGVSPSTQKIKVDTVTQKSASNINSKVKYTAEDSIRFDRAKNIVYLYGKARITYSDFALDADYIRLDQEHNIAFAKGYYDAKTNRYRGRPIFKQGQESPVTTDSLIFNFKTKKGKSYGTYTSEDQGYLHARQFKKNEYGEGFFTNGVYTTCNASHPHFGIHITRGILGEKQIAAGPMYLEVEDVPTPLGLPFGFFPKTNKRKSGLIFPTFTEDAARGFLVKDLGYYFSISDYWDLATKGSFYSKGSYMTDATARYEKRYKHSGNLMLSYAVTFDPTIVEGTPGDTPAKDFKIQWSHLQRPEANPGTTFSASVNAGTGSYSQNTAAGGTYSYNQIIQNTLASSISYGKDMGLFNFSSALRHNQDIQKHTINLTLPEATLKMSTIYPFAKVGPVGGQKWYQKINTNYTANGKNLISTTDTTLFKGGIFTKFQNGVQHTVPFVLSLNVLKFFQVTPNIQYSETWYSSTIRQSYVGGITPTIITDTVPGFARAYAYSLNTGVSTKFYGVINFKKGRLAALRHVVTPSVSFNYNPDFGSDKFGYYRNVANAPANSFGQIPRYSIFQNGVYSGPSAGKAASIAFTINNNIEAKRRSKTKQDSTSSTNKPTFDKIPIMQNLTFSGNYNFAVDSFQLSTITINARNSFFKQKIGLSLDGSFDPYQMNAQGVRISQYAFNKGQLARLTSLSLALDLTLRSSDMGKKKSHNRGLQNMNPQQAEELEQINRDLNAFVDFNIPWNLTARYNLIYAKPGLQSNIQTNSLTFNGDLSVTPKWKVTFNSGYDFIAHQVTLTQLGIYRDLHCWDLAFSWTPLGPFRNYSVDLKVKASVLQDLKLSKRRNYNSNGF